MLHIVSCIVKEDFIRGLGQRICVFTVPFWQGCIPRIRSLAERNSPRRFWSNLLPPRVKCTAVCTYDIAGIPEERRELITTFRPLFQAFNLDCREQSEEFVLFGDRLVQSELRVFELCATCLRHVLVLGLCTTPISPASHRDSSRVATRCDSRDAWFAFACNLTADLDTPQQSCLHRFSAVVLLRLVR